MAFNEQHHITPKGIQKAIPDLIKDFGDLTGISTPEKKVESREDIPNLIANLRQQMLKEAEALNFEEATRLRDRIRALEAEELAEA